MYITCTRTEFAGSLTSWDNGYSHFMGPSCHCGTSHSDGWIAPRPVPQQRREEPPSLEALGVWNQATAATGTVVDTYLASRGITIPAPPTLRYHPSPLGSEYPAMIAAVVNPREEIAAIHRTFLRHDGLGKAPIEAPKKRLGSAPGGSIWLSVPEETIVLCEGIEDGLAIKQQTGRCVWVVMGAGNFATAGLPQKPLASRVILAIDGDDAGRRGAYNAVERLEDEGREVLIAEPETGGDWNDMIKGHES